MWAVPLRARAHRPQLPTLPHILPQNKRLPLQLLELAYSTCWKTRRTTQKKLVSLSSAKAATRMPRTSLRAVPTRQQVRSSCRSECAGGTRNARPVQTRRRHAMRASSRKLLDKPSSRAWCHSWNRSPKNLAQAIFPTRSPMQTTSGRKSIFRAGRSTRKQWMAQQLQVLVQLLLLPAMCPWRCRISLCRSMEGLCLYTSCVRSLVLAVRRAVRHSRPLGCCCSANISLRQDQQLWHQQLRKKSWMRARACSWKIVTISQTKLRTRARVAPERTRKSVKMRKKKRRIGANLRANLDSGRR
mmetsp:Transcript_46379/g.148983  ORF Transcript_46379/g.148983 Transcript_46379/m.148983 type:complete len:300 (+) Transcript_46379:1381-2280(+)